MKTTQCQKCNHPIKNCNFKKHVVSCDGSWKPERSKSCIHCGVSYDGMSLNEKGNHTRWCDKNPKILENKLKQSENVGHYLTSPEYAEKREEAKGRNIAGIKKAWKDGKYDLVDFGSAFRGRTHTEETKKKIQEKALASSHRRLVKSTRPFTQKDGTIILLDSSWEEALAKRLDSLDIVWIRPKEPIKWIDKKKAERNYFPDFYLPDHNLYLDPKNPAAFAQQAEKVKWLTHNLSNLIFIKTLQECHNFSI